MSRYRKIDVRIHNDSKFRTLSDKGKLLWFTLLTFPDLTAIGCMRFTEAGMAENMKWPPKAFQEAFREVLSKGMILYDQEAKFLCFPNFIRYNQPENPNVVKSWSKIDGLLPECKMKEEYIQSVKDFVEGIGKGFGEAFPKGLLKGYGETGTGTGTGTGTEEPPLPPLAGGIKFSVQNLATLWNLKAPPELNRVVMPFNRKPKDMEKIRDAIKRNPEVDWWERVVLSLYSLPFVKGINDRGWKMTLDVMVRDAEKILDGKYSGGKPPQPKTWEAIKESMRRRVPDEG